MFLEFYNKETKLTTFEYDEVLANVVRDNYQIHCKDKLPYNFDKNNLKDFIQYMEQWLSLRLANKRKHIDKLYERLGLTSIGAKIVYSYGLSLNDTFWIKPVGADINWKDINLYKNKFSYEIAQLSFCGVSETNSETFNKLSPEPTTAGIVPKFWERRDDGIYLIKGSETPDYISEEIAYKIAKHLNINCTEYKIEKRKNKIVSACKLFTNEELGLIPANSIMSKDIISINYPRTIDLLLQMGINLEPLYDMLILDFVIANIDRHRNNWAFYIDNETQEIKSFSPIYDNGFAFLSQAKSEEELSEKFNRLKKNGLYWSSYKIKYIDIIPTETIKKHLPKIKTILKDIDIRYSFRYNPKDIYRIKYMREWIEFATEQLEKRLESKTMNTISF